MPDYSLKLYHGVQCYTKVSIIQLSQLKTEPFWLRWTMLHPTRMSDNELKSWGGGSQQELNAAGLILKAKMWEKGLMLFLLAKANNEKVIFC